MQHKLIGPMFLTCVLSGNAWAQIYETTDEHGNKVFSDTPSSGSEVVDLPDANIADSVEPAPRPQKEITPSAPQTGSAKDPYRPGGQVQGDNDDEYIIADTYDDRLDEKLARERRKEVLDAERPHEVLEADPPRDMREADPLKHKAVTPHHAPKLHRR